MTLVSIVTPSYNQAQYLEETVHSVLGQEYSPLEYLIVDGGSEDDSLEIIQKYAHRLAWWISETDSGQAEAINKGLARAKGEIVAWLNSDDLLIPGAVEQAVSILQAHPAAGMVIGDAITIDAHGQPLNTLSLGDWGFEEFMRFRIICQPAVFMRRSVLEKTGYLDREFHFLLDHQLWIRLARVASVKHVSATWAAARHHPEAKNVAQAAGFGAEAFHILDWMESQTDLAPLVKKNRRHIEAGAYRLNARYLLDGGLYSQALRAYGGALVRSPGFALQHWHRILYAFLSLLGGKRLAKFYYRLRPKRIV